VRRGRKRPRRRRTWLSGRAVWAVISTTAQGQCWRAGQNRRDGCEVELLELKVSSATLRCSASVNGDGAAVAGLQLAAAWQEHTGKCYCQVEAGLLQKDGAARGVGVLGDHTILGRVITLSWEVHVSDCWLQGRVSCCVLSTCASTHLYWEEAQLGNCCIVSIFFPEKIQHLKQTAASVCTG
jgi:hypothetical protein